MSIENVGLNHDRIIAFSYAFSIPRSRARRSPAAGRTARAQAPRPRRLNSLARSWDALIRECTSIPPKAYVGKKTPEQGILKALTQVLIGQTQTKRPRIVQGYLGDLLRHVQLEVRGLAGIDLQRVPLPDPEQAVEKEVRGNLSGRVHRDVPDSVRRLRVTGNGCPPAPPDRDSAPTSPEHQRVT